jgi:hypothetical protein
VVVPVVADGLLDRLRIVLVRDLLVHTSWLYWVAYQPGGPAVGLSDRRRDGSDPTVVSHQPI